MINRKFKWITTCALLFLLFAFISPVNGQTSDSAENVPDAGAYLTEFLVHSVAAPRRDDYDLYSRLKKDLGPNPPRTTTKPVYQLGDKDTFWVLDQERKQYYKVNATLVALTAHVYMFLDDGFKVDVNALRTAAEAFENKVYPTNRRFFGSEPLPGVDNDPRLIILNTPLKLASGYFSAEDALLQSVNPYSNEREMFFIYSQPANQDSYLGTLAHEFQHMIEFNRLPSQDNWLNEGSSVLAQILNGYSSGGVDNAFMSRPGTQLNSWACTPCGGVTAQYGAGFSWLAYLNDRFGFEVIRNIAGNGQGLTGFNSVDWSLATTTGTDLSGDSIFKQWVIANYLNRRTADPLYSYKSVSTQVNAVTPAKLPFNPPQLKLNQYAAQYFDVTADENGFSLDFKGLPGAKLAPTNPHSGKMVWWANRGDNSNMKLTREVDLSKVSSANLKFWTWFDIEPDYDYLYLEASSDNGVSWEVLPGKYTSPLKPTSRAYGPSLTGQSAATGPDLSDQEAVVAGWVQENIDLSKYAGKKIKIRLEYVTDEGYNRNGALFDDFEIPEIGWSDNVEGGINGWQSEGFLRVNNSIPQRYAVQVISRDGACADPKATDLSKANNGQSCIQQLTLDSTNAARQFFPYKRAVVVVAPYAVRTLVPTQFNLKLTSGR